MEELQGESIPSVHGCCECRVVEMVMRHGVRMSHRRTIAVAERCDGGSWVGNRRWHHHGSLLLDRSLVLVLLVLIPIAALLRSVRVVHHRIGHLQNEYKKSTLLIRFTK